MRYDSENVILSSPDKWPRSYFIFYLAFLLIAQSLCNHHFLIKMQTHKGQRELAPHRLKISCFNQVADGLISSRVALRGPVVWRS